MPEVCYLLPVSSSTTTQPERMIVKNTWRMKRPEEQITVNTSKNYQTANANCINKDLNTKKTLKSKKKF